MSGIERPGLTDEQLAIGRTTEELLAKRSREVDVRLAMSTPAGFLEEVWRELAELGLPAIAVPQKYGGVGLGWTEMGLVMQAAGASLLCAPLFSSGVLATALLIELGDESSKTDLLPSVADGTRRATVAFGLPHIGLAARRTDGVVGHQEGGRWFLTGRCLNVIDGATADDILVVSRSSGRFVVLAVTGDAPGLSRTAVCTLDLTRKQAELILDRTPARPVAVGEDVAAGLERVMDLAMVMLAAEQVGGAQRCLDTAVEYATTRVQFDRIIGSFQAVKHTCANMLIQLEGAKATMIDGTRVADHLPRAMFPAAASLAKVVCSEAFFGVASDALHIHGGIGFTWEHASHLYFRRAKSSEMMFGSAAAHRERLLTLSGLARQGGVA